MDTPENYYAILGVPSHADFDTVKRAYRQLARRFHPDLAGPEGAIQMKKINRAYAVIGDPDKRQHYDTIMGGVMDFRKRGFARPQQRQRPQDTEDVEFSGLNTFSTKGPFRAGPIIQTNLGVISALNSSRTVQGSVIAGGTLDGKGTIWQVNDGKVEQATTFASDPSFAIESLRELRFSEGGSLLSGWHRMGLHVWDAYHGQLLWSYPLGERAVSAHYSLDMALHVGEDNKRIAYMALPHLAEDVRAPRAWGVRSTDISSHDLQDSERKLHETITCTEETIEKRNFWAIRMRALSQDAQTLVTLSCAQVANESQQMAIVRKWDLAGRGRLGKKQQKIVSSILVGRCEDCTPPYASTADLSLLAFVFAGKMIRLCDTNGGTYSEFASGTMGSGAKLAISPDGQWLAVAREDSEINEGVIDLWSVTTGQIAQKFYHPWQISALHFADKQLVVALTDGTIQIWQ